MRRRTFCLATLSLALTACGFHRRGVVALPFTSLFVDVDSESAFGAKLRRMLKAASDVTLTNSPKEAQATLSLIQDKQARHVISLNTRGEAREYELTKTMVFRIVAPDGKEYLAPTVFQSSRNMTYNASDYTSRASEERRLYDEMTDDILTRLINTMGALQ
ncbi:MAG TPA: hypothetical protein DCW60_03390 [Sutterella sp.]|nr:hypothetical protein [Sutterella sp.]